MSKTIFKNLQLNQEFQNQGFVKIDLCTSDDLLDLQKLFYALEEDYSIKEFHATMNNKHEKIKREIYTSLKKRIALLCENILADFEPLFANFIFKRANSSYKVGIHQDWSYVDEKEDTSLNVWLPLSATNEVNGGLLVLPKSHKLPLFARYTPFEDPFEGCANDIREKSKLICTKLGEAILYDSRLIHFSNENKSHKDRIACACVMIPKESTPIHYFKQNDLIYEYSVDEDFFLSPPSLDQLSTYRHIVIDKDMAPKLPEIHEFITKL